MKKRKINLLAALLVFGGGLAFMVFAVPLSLTVTLNIGNLTGVLVSGMAVVYGLFFSKINRLRREWKRQRGKRFIVCFIEGMVVLVACLVLLLSVLMIKGALNKPQGNETLIVLGCRVYGENPSLSLRERLDAAYKYLSVHPEAYCVVSGGQGTGEDISEAECMYRYLTDKGIDGDRIFKEDKSTSTRENIAFSMQVIAENELPAEIAIATSEYHQYRVSLIAKGLGVKNTAVSGKTAPWLFPTFYLRELYAILYEWVI
ncbi:MAG: YdcF family protein [Lachnospiraceae bacterium]|nr:YdcF family protein [Lachnospiraceae bacterium]